MMYSAAKKEYEKVRTTVGGRGDVQFFVVVFVVHSIVRATHSFE